jgi:hypothetical protein
MLPERFTTYKGRIVYDLHWGYAILADDTLYYAESASTKTDWRDYPRVAISQVEYDEMLAVLKCNWADRPNPRSAMYNCLMLADLDAVYAVARQAASWPDDGTGMGSTLEGWYRLLLQAYEHRFGAVGVRNYQSLDPDDLAEAGLELACESGLMSGSN